MSTLALASLAFLVTHLGISSTPLRGVLVRTLGENGYLGLYTLVAFATLGAMIYAWVNLPQTEFVRVPGLAATAVARALMPISAVLLVAGLMAKNPTAVKMDATVGGESVDGILKITRHPLQWAILIWAVAHLVANADQASLVFFGTFAIVSGVGTIAMDRRFRAREDPAWQRFFSTTSNVPFAAIVAGRTRLQAGELNWAAIGIGIVLFVVLYMFHEWVSGVPLY